ncbi:hypothetical protein DK66_3050 [Brucella suis 1330]|nr:hypothetical protein DK66_3050 [Brucella suis 1330]
MNIQSLEFHLGSERKRTNEVVSEFALGTRWVGHTSNHGIIQITSGKPASSAGQAHFKLIRWLVIGTKAKEPDICLRRQAGARSTIPRNSRSRRPLVIELMTDTAANRPTILIVKVQTGDLRAFGSDLVIRRNKVHRCDARPVGPLDRAECEPVRGDTGLELEFNRLRRSNIALHIKRHAPPRYRVQHKIVDRAFKVILNFRLIDERGAHRIFRNFVSSTKTPANQLIFSIKRCYPNRPWKRKLRRIHVWTNARNQTGLLTLQFLIADAAKNSEITFFPCYKAIGTVHTIIMRRNLLLDCGEHANCVGTDISLDTPGLTILRRTGKIAGDVEFGGNLWNLVALGLIDFCFIRTPGRGINASRNKILPPGPLRGFFHSRAANILQLALWRNEGSASFDGVTIFKKNIEILRATLKPTRMSHNRTAQQSSYEPSYFHASHLHECPPRQQRH